MNKKDIISKLIEYVDAVDIARAQLQVVYLLKVVNPTYLQEQAAWELSYLSTTALRGHNDISTVKTQVVLLEQDLKVGSKHAIVNRVLTISESLGMSPNLLLPSLLRAVCKLEDLRLDNVYKRQWTESKTDEDIVSELVRRYVERTGEALSTKEVNDLIEDTYGFYAN